MCHSRMQDCISDCVHLCANSGLLRQLATSWHDVQSCAVDPGAVRSSIWKRAGPIMQWIANHLFAPNEDGCKTVIHAATDAWEPVPETTDTNKQPATLRVDSHSLLYNMFSACVPCNATHEVEELLLGFAVLLICAVLMQHNHLHVRN